MVHGDRRLREMVLALCTVLILMAGTYTTALAKDGDAGTDRYYQITYRPGKTGRFTKEWYEKLRKYCEQNNYPEPVLSGETGNISVNLPAGAAYPDAPAAEDVDTDLDTNQGSYFFRGWKTETGGVLPVGTVTGDADFVVSYGALKDGVEYIVRYIDAVSGAEVAVSVISAGNIGETVSATAKTVENYRYDEAQKTITLRESAAENVIEFYYTDTRSPLVNEVVHREEEKVTTEIRETEESAAVEEMQETTVEATEETTAVIEDSGDGVLENTENEELETVALGEEETPLGKEDKALPGNAWIDDPEVPLAKGMFDNPSFVGLYGGVAVIAFAAAVIIVVFRRRKKGKEEE